MSSLPTRDEMLRNALVDLERARDALSSASDWMRSDWHPVGSPLTAAQSKARTRTNQAVTNGKHEIESAITAIRRGLAGAAS